MKNILPLFLVLALFLGLCACSDNATDSVSDSHITKLSFKSASGYDYLKTLNGTTVSINGYMATSSPVDGSFLFLMNLPYQNCPFCVPNTSELSNTIEVYPKDGESFAYTSQAITVVGTLVVAESEDKPFQDMYGYEFNFEIVDADYTILQSQDLSEELQLWQKIADSDVITDIYAMYDYVNFLCAWNTYYVNSYTNEDGQSVTGYYLYASDAENYIYTEGAQWNYGYQDGYFADIIDRIKAIDPEAFQSLIDNIVKAEALAQKALLELQNGSYTCEYQYVEMFGTEDYVYTLTNGEMLKAEFTEIYQEFAQWIASWEL